MQNVIDTVMGNLPFFIGLFVFVVFTVGFVIALLTPAGREALGTAAVRFAVFVLSLAEKWLDREIVGEQLDSLAANGIAPQHPIIRAQASLQSWLDR